MNIWTVKKYLNMNEGKNFDVVSIADLCIDIIITGTVKPIYGQVEQLVDHYTIDVGGSVGIFASQFAKLGGTVCLFGKVGDDTQGKIVLEKLASAGVDVSLVDICSDTPTAMGLNLSCNNDRALLACLAAIDLIDKDIFKQTMNVKTRHWHIGSYFLLKGLVSSWTDFIKELKKKKVTVSLDTNWDPEENWNAVLEILPLVDIFLPNEAEALSITGQDNVLKAGEKLATYCPLVVIKCGEKGAMIFTNNEVFEYPIPESLLADLKILDTTGAGDNFDAGFLFSWLQGEKSDACITLAFKCAISSLKALGGVQMQVVEKITND
jgi:ribokinase